MQIVMMASGTRGDVQPMIALGKALKVLGHQVRLVAGANFVDWIKSHGLDVYPTIDIEKLMQSEAGIKWVESPNQLDQLKALKAMTNTLIQETIHDTIEGAAGADLLIGGFLSQSYLLAISEKFNIPVLTVALQPFRPTSSGAATMMPIMSRRSSALNRWMGLLAERFTWSIVEQTTNALREHLGLPAINARQYSQTTGKIPALIAISPHVVPQTSDSNSYTTGYWFLDEAFTPADDLVRFIEDGDPPIYFGFGSMPDSNPSQTLDMISNVLNRLNRRGVIVSGWSEMTTEQSFDRLFLAKQASHTWLFPKMSILVHHGGAGTVAAGLRAGKSALIIPHMGDQPYWAQRLYDLGLSPKPLNRHKLSVESLTERLNKIIQDRDMQNRAIELGNRIQAEQGVKNAVDWIENYIASHL